MRNERGGEREVVLLLVRHSQASRPISQPASGPASRRVQRCDGVLVQDGIRVQLTLEGRRRREAARARTETGDPNKEKRFSEEAATKWPAHADRLRVVVTHPALQSLLTLHLVHTVARQFVVKKTKKKQWYGVNHLCHLQFSALVNQ